MFNDLRGPVGAGQHLGSVHSEAVGAETCVLTVALTPELWLPLSCFAEAGNDLEPHRVIKIKWGEDEYLGRQGPCHPGPGSEAGRSADGAAETWA